MRPAKWSHWNDDERRELAVYIKKAIEKKTKITVACAVASKKMARTRGACEYQYQKYLKNNLEYYLTPVEEEVVTVPEETFPLVSGDAIPEPKQTWTAEKGEAIAQPQEEAQLPQPTIQVYGNFGEPELAEIISHTGDMIIARARGLFFTIKL